MEYVGINEQCEEWRGTWQDSEFMAKINERQRERDFRDGYMRGFEIAKSISVENTAEYIDRHIVQAMVETAKQNKPEVKRVEVIQHSPPYNGRAYTNYAAKEVEVQYQDGGRTLKIFCK
jgi:hypothetical protein